MIPLSKLGIGKADRKMLEERLFPEVNKIFLENLAKENGLKFTDIAELDYESNPTYEHEQWIRRRELNASRNVKFPEEKLTKYEKFEDAKSQDKKYQHILLNDEDKKYHERYRQNDQDDEKEDFESCEEKTKEL